MPITTLQRQLRELGRIRTGIQEGSGSKRRPAKLETFRLTSSSRQLLEHAAEAFGGEVKPWTGPAGEAFELITKTATLEIILPPGQRISQWYELWTGGGCQRRCDGVREVLTDVPCLCPPDPVERQTLAAKGEACKPTTRLSVMLPQLPDLGVWRLESHGFYAAVELAGVADVLAAATAADRILPARLRLEQRTTKRAGQPTRRYAVPVIEIGATAAELFASASPALLPSPSGEGRPATPPGRPALPAGPEPPVDAAFRPIVPPASDPAPDPVAAELPASSDFGPGHSARNDPAWAQEEPAELTSEAFKAFLRDQRISGAYALEVGRRLFAGQDPRSWTPIQLARLAEKLTQEASNA